MTMTPDRFIQFIDERIDLKVGRRWDRGTIRSIGTNYVMLDWPYEEDPDADDYEYPYPAHFLPVVGDDVLVDLQAPGGPMVAGGLGSGIEHQFGSSNILRYDTANSRFVMDDGADGDTNAWNVLGELRLYRASGAAYVLLTDPTNYNASNVAFAMKNTGEMQWGPSGSGRDVKLYRSGVNQMYLEAMGGSSTNNPLFRLLSDASPASTDYTAFAVNRDNDVAARFVAGYMGDVEAVGIAMGAGTGARDVYLYRESANVLATDDLFKVKHNSGIVVNSAASNWLLRNFVVGTDTQPKFGISADGALYWGAGGSSAVDTNLYRSEANMLYSSDDLTLMGGTLKLGTTAANAASISIMFGADIELYRNAANELMLLAGDSFKIDAGGLQTKDTWHSATLTNSWVAYGSPYSTAGAEYIKDAEGWVHLRGLIKSGTLGAAAFTLPTGYRPPYQMLFAIITPVTSSAPYVGTGRLDITTAGAVSPHANYAANGYVSLDGIKFYVG